MFLFRSSVLVSFIALQRLLWGSVAGGASCDGGDGKDFTLPRGQTQVHGCAEGGEEGVRETSLERYIVSLTIYCLAFKARHLIVTSERAIASPSKRGI